MLRKMFVCWLMCGVAPLVAEAQVSGVREAPNTMFHQDSTCYTGLLYLVQPSALSLPREPISTHVELSLVHCRYLVPLTLSRSRGHAGRGPAP